MENEKISIARIQGMSIRPVLVSWCLSVEFYEQFIKEVPSGRLEVRSKWVNLLGHPFKESGSLV